jgi:CRISPR-associated protein Cmr4
MTETALLYLHALTGLHPGSGTALGVVDMPVQRERHTGWPTIPGTSLKGVIRAEARGRAGLGDEFFAVFGPDTKDAADHAVAFTDARILAFPVRSLRGVFAWVTCPAVLDRLSRDLEVAGGKFLGKAPILKGDQALVCKDSPLQISDGDRQGMVLEEFDFACSPGADEIGKWLAARAVADDATRSRLTSHTVLISDDAFGHFVQHATEVTARIALNYETKTVDSERGALFYEEFLPPETLFYSLLIAQPARSAKVKMDPAGVLDWISRLDLKIIQIGGGETIGKGFCAARLDRTARSRP